MIAGVAGCQGNQPAAVLSALSGALRAGIMQSMVASHSCELHLTCALPPSQSGFCLPRPAKRRTKQCSMSALEGGMRAEAAPAAADAGSVHLRHDLQHLNFASGRTSPESTPLQPWQSGCQQPTQQQQQQHRPLPLVGHLSCTPLPSALLMMFHALWMLLLAYVIQCQCCAG